MPKKRINLDEENEIDDMNDQFEEEVENLEEEIEEEVEEDKEESTNLIDLSDDDDNIDMIIEIDDSDIDFIEPEKKIETTDCNNEEEIVLSKHKIQGKHSLKYDSIFKGKKDIGNEEFEGDATSMYFNENFEVDKSSNYHYESIDNESYIREKNLKEKVYYVLANFTDLNFMNNRRKPSKSDFNHYYFLLKNNLKDESFTNIELFNELSVYFSDNLFNMFKLLDNKWKNLIISELQDHIGKNPGSKDIKNRNIYVGTEIEFEYIENDDEILVSGIVIETIYDENIFKVDSMERIYYVELESITKILNNNKFKYNLNKLNNIDFL